MGDQFNNNPFAGLFTSTNEAPDLEPESNTVPPMGSSKSVEYKLNEEKLLQEVFGVLKNNSAPLTKAQLFPVDSDTADEAIYLRITATNIGENLLPSTTSQEIVNPLTLETQALPYTFGCFCELEKLILDPKLEEVARNLQRVLIRYVAIILEEPSCVNEQQVHAQYIALFKDSSIIPQVTAFSRELAIMMIEERPENAEDALMDVFHPLMDIIYHEIKDSRHLVFHQYWFNFLQVMANVEPLAEILIRYSTPERPSGASYADTLLSAPLSLSCLPKRLGDPYDFFSPPLAQPKTVENNIWSAVEYITEAMYHVFHSLLKCSAEIRHLTLKWLGQCIEANSDRAQLSHGNALVLSSNDGFMLNLGHVLLRLCQPFISQNHDKVPKIDPTYCAAVMPENFSGDCHDSTSYIYLKGLHHETCLVPTPKEESRPVAQSFHFVTQCFFLTQRTLHLGYNVVFDKFIKANRDMMIAQQTYNISQSTLTGDNLESVSHQLEASMTKFLSFKASLTTPDMIKHLVRFHATTAFWLTQVMIDDTDSLGYQAASYLPNKVKTITFPLPESVPQTWKCIPEFIVENTIHFLTVIRRVDQNIFEEYGQSFLDPILTEIIVLMESPKRLFNPHLRAQLAEALEALVPASEDAKQGPLGSFHREQLFLIHPHRQEIVGNLLEVFVSIEMTGQSVQFEQKFNYRRPMYGVMEYLWRIKEHRNIFKSLAETAEENIEAVQPPLFLRFSNLLINDAVFLIDDALSNMAQLKRLQQDRDNGEWNKLPAMERAQRQALLQQTENIARFDNILSRKTISTLKMLTTEIKSIFCHPTMVDRIASMLNYILLQLVGPKNRNFKVKSQENYEFNPAFLVRNICEIYIYLRKNDNFILAVSQDGRSYSPELFQMADDVLVRIGGASILEHLSKFAERVQKAANIKKKEDEILTDAPEEFLDPIMSTIMTDPVTLPSSKIAIDRQTIARHLLSDQTDPFNRSPLTMDMVKPDEELRNKIQSWIASKKQEASTSDE